MGGQQPSFLKDFIFENGSYKVVALLITLILWITVLGNKDQVLNQTVRLNFILPKNHIISNSLNDQVQVQISGSRLSLKKLARGIEPININLEDAKPGRTIITIPTDTIPLPFGAQIVNINPASIVVDIDRVITKRIPIRVTWDSEDEPVGMKIAQISPSTVVVRGGATVLSRITEVWTDPINPSEILFDRNKSSLEVRIGLKEFNFYGVLPFETKNVNVKVEKL